MTDPIPSSAPIPQPLTWEQHLPEWQQKLNTFCENWIFAFLVAMAIRHVALEAFRIPSASMEPMLYGDPGLMKGDFVVVDKLFCRFTGVRRWDVTVFQFPQPEVEAPGNDARPAIDASGERLDVPMLRPLMYRNFVKRAVILPGDTFFIRCGNIYLKQPDGRFQASRKPPAIQEKLWQEIYHHGAQDGYLPWVAAGGSVVATQGDSIAYNFANRGAVTFTQPLRNLYLKPGIFRVHPAGQTSAADELLELAMTKPVFTYRRTGVTGNAWDLNSWEVSRMNSADLDNNTYGTLLNQTMTEMVSDVRVHATVAKLEGDASIELSAGSHVWKLTLVPAGWQLECDGAPVAQGVDTPQGAEISFAHLDDQVIATVGGKEVVRWDVPALNTGDLLSVRLNGTGSLVLKDPRIDRDLHYTTRGFLTDGRGVEIACQRNLDQAQGNLSVDPITVDKTANTLRLISQVRAQMLGKPEDQLSRAERVAPIGTGPENALTAPANAYLLMGDNSPQSWDGREWGWVPGENIRGRALVVAFPPARWRLVK